MSNKFQVSLGEDDAINASHPDIKFRKSRAGEVQNTMQDTSRFGGDGNDSFYNAFDKDDEDEVARR